MPNPWGLGRSTALAIAASVPAGYVWLRLNYPSFWKDFQTLKLLARLNSSLTRALNSGVTFIEVFDKYAQEQPDHPCVLFENESYTYGEVQANANRTARWVIEADPKLKKGDVVCVLLHNGPHFAWTWLGFLKTGIIASLLNYNLKPAALLHCIRVSEAKKLIFGAEFLHIVQELLPELQQMDIELWMINDTQIPEHMVPADAVIMDISTASGEPFPNEPMTMTDTAAFIFTSGTTGLPKPAKIPHRKIIRGMFLHFFSDLTPDDVYYVTLPMYHSAALIMSFSGILYKGGTAAIARKFSASHFWDDVRRYNVSVIQYIGELCRYLLAQPKRMDDGKYPRKLRLALGNGLRPEIWEEFKTRFNIDRIIEVYAATEGNSGFINIDGKVGSIGRYPWFMKRLVDNLEIVDFDFNTGEPKRARDGRCIRKPVGVTGLALLKIDDKSPFTGYKGSRDMNEKKIVRNVKKNGDIYFNTGDLLKIDEEDYLYFMDRIGDTFRWKGENVSTMEVSQVLSSFPAIMEANVYGVEIPGQDGRAGMAAVVLQEGAILDLQDLYAHVASSLPDYACPKFLRVMESMDITGTFKHRKVDLVKQGFDVNVIDDEVYIIEPSQKTYIPLTSRHIHSLLAGQAKL